MLAWILRVEYRSPPFVNAAISSRVCKKGLYAIMRTHVHSAVEKKDKMYKMYVTTVQFCGRERERNTAMYARYVQKNSYVILSLDAGRARARIINLSVRHHPTAVLLSHIQTLSPVLPTLIQSWRKTETKRYIEGQADEREKRVREW